MADIRKPGPKFPPTRLLKASYEDIVPNGCHNEQVTKVLNELVHSAYFTNQSRPLQTTHPFESRDSSLCTRTERLKKALSEQISELDQSIRIQEEMMQQSLPYIKTLIHVSKLESSLTAVTLNCCSLATPTLSRVRQCGIVKCCKCSQRALPYTRFCTDHIHLSRQCLYRCCTSIDLSTKARCTHPVPDILSTSSTCHKHHKPVTELVGTTSPSKKGVGRGALAKGVLSGSRSKLMKVPSKRTALPNILKPHKVPPKEPQHPTQSTLSQQPSTDSTPSQQPLITQSTPSQAPSTPTTSPQKSLDDLLTLGPPLQSLDLPPLEADLGDIMMAGEEEGNE